MTITELLATDKAARKARREGGIDGLICYVDDHAARIIPHLDDDALDFIEQAKELVILRQLPGVNERPVLTAAAAA
ncbi:hypothetical protein ACWGJ9_11495 [Curtobacterium citreum]